MNSSEPRSFRYWISVVGWMIVIFLLSSIPGDELPSVGIPHIDRIAHLVEYLILGGLLARAFSHSFPDIAFNPPSKEFPPVRVGMDSEGNSALARFSLRRSGKKNSAGVRAWSFNKIMMFSIITAVLYAATDEWHQYFVSARTPDTIDFVFDIIGSSFGVLIYKKSKKWGTYVTNKTV